MSETKHTPGPWQAFGQRVVAPDMPRIEYGERQQYSRGYCVTQTQLYTDPDCETAEANARLIAAAPDLLEVMERALEHSNCPGENCVIDWHARAKVVIAKAKGEAQ